MRLDIYIEKKDSSGYELIDSDNIDYNPKSLNIDKIRLFLINLFKDKIFLDKEYSIKVNQNKHKFKKGLKLRQTSISVFFKHDIEIKRELRINKLIKND